MVSHYTEEVNFHFRKFSKFSVFTLMTQETVTTAPKHTHIKT